jgi:hypothetical protein
VRSQPVSPKSNAINIATTSFRAGCNLLKFLAATHLAAARWDLLIIRNRQVSGSSPLVGSILFKSLINNQFTETCCISAARAILASSCFIASVTTLGTVLMSHLTSKSQMGMGKRLASTTERHSLEMRERHSN